MKSVRNSAGCEDLHIGTSRFKLAPSLLTLAVRIASLCERRPGFVEGVGELALSGAKLRGICDQTGKRRLEDVHQPLEWEDPMLSMPSGVFRVVMACGSLQLEGVRRA